MSDKILNPATGNMVMINSIVGRKILKKQKAAAAKAKVKEPKIEEEEEDEGYVSASDEEEKTQEELVSSLTVARSPGQASSASSSSSRSKAITKNELAVMIIEAFQKSENFTDDEIKNILTSANVPIPRSLPKKWGGSAKFMKSKDRPKRAKTAYNYFSSEIRPIIAKKFPNAPASAKKGNPDGVETIMSLIGKEWNALEDKSKYEKMAASDKIRYTAEMDVYYENHPDEQPATKKTSQSKTTGYRIFCDKNRQKIKNQNPSMSGRDILKCLSEEWKNLNGNDKAVYLNEAKEANTGVVSAVAKPKIKLSKSIDDPNYIINPKTQRKVKKDSKIGKQILATSKVQTRSMTSLNDDDLDLEISDD